MRILINLGIAFLAVVIATAIALCLAYFIYWLNMREPSIKKEDRL